MIIDFLVINLVRREMAKNYSNRESQYCGCGQFLGRGCGQFSGRGCGQFMVLRHRLVPQLQGILASSRGNL